MIKGSNTKIKVSQATIDKIKKMGMTAALKSAPKANAEMTEALRRMYGQRRLDAASKTTTVSKPSRAVMTRPGSPTKSNAPGAISGRTPVKMPKAGPAVKIAQPKRSIGLPGVTRGGSSPKSNAPKADKYAAVAAINAKRMGISVAEYNRRLNANKK